MHNHFANMQQCNTLCGNSLKIVHCKLATSFPATVDGMVHVPTAAKNSCAINADVHRRRVYNRSRENMYRMRS